MGLKLQSQQSNNIADICNTQAVDNDLPLKGLPTYLDPCGMLSVAVAMFPLYFTVYSHSKTWID